MTPLARNLFTDVPSHLQDEFFQTLAVTDSVRIERIVSEGHVTPPGEWYDQQWDEWVLLISGSAIVLFAEDAASLTLKPGDHVMIPAKCRHRVEWTDPDRQTIWVAVHCAGSTGT